MENHYINAEIISHLCARVCARKARNKMNYNKS